LRSRLESRGAAAQGAAIGAIAVPLREAPAGA
jgi:hypothetical protein